MKQSPRRGWIKLRVAFDINSKQVVSVEVTDEKTHDSQKAEELVSDWFKICVNSAILDNLPSKRIISWDHILLPIQLLTPYNGLRYKVFE